MAIKVFDTFIPAVDSDEYPVVNSSHVQGGYHNVLTKAERDAIPLSRRKEGMQVSVLEDGNLVYILDGGLDNNHWKIFTPTLYKKDDPIWNANRLYNIDITTGSPSDGNLLSYNEENNEIEYVSIEDLITNSVTTDTIPEGSDNLYYTDDRVRDFVINNPELFETVHGVHVIGEGTPYEMSAQEIHEHMNDIRIHVLPIDDTIATDENLWSAQKVNETITGIFDGDVTIEGDLTIGGSIFELSSYIYKRDIESLNSKLTLDRVLELNPVHYVWKKTGRQDYGFIAEEVEKIFPEFVSGSKTKRVNYSKMVSLLVQCVKELNDELTQLKKHINRDEIGNNRET